MRLVGGIFGVIVVLAVIMTLTQGYRSDRMSFLDPWADPDDTGYQLIHSFKAFAAGGLFGLGIGNSYEKLLYLPESRNGLSFFPLLVKSWACSVLPWWLFFSWFSCEAAFLLLVKPRVILVLFWRGHLRPCWYFRLS